MQIPGIPSTFRIVVPGGGFFLLTRSYICAALYLHASQLWIYSREAPASVQYVNVLDHRAVDICTTESE